MPHNLDPSPRSHRRRTCHQGHGRFRWRSGIPCSRCQTSPASIGIRSFQTSTPWNWIISTNHGKRWVCIHTIKLVHCSLPPFATKHLQADALARRDVWKNSWKQAPWHDGEWKSWFFSPLCSWLMAWADCSVNTSSSSLSNLSFIQFHHQSPQSYPISTHIISTIHLDQSTIRDSCQPQRPWWNQVPSGRERPRLLHRKYPGRSPRWKCLWIYRPWPAGIGRRCEQVANRVENANARTTLTFLDCPYVSRLIPKLQDWSRNIFWNSFYMNTLIK